MTTTAPLVPRPMVTAATIALLTFMGWSVYKGDYRSTLILLVPLLFVLGADVGALVRAYRGQPEPKPPTVPPDPTELTP